MVSELVFGSNGEQDKSKNPKFNEFIIKDILSNRPLDPYW